MKTRREETRDEDEYKTRGETRGGRNRVKMIGTRI